MKKICFIAQFPPPMHGLSKAVETLYNSNLNFEIDSQGEFEFEKVDITNNKNFIKNLLKISRSKADLFYFTISQTKGGNLRDLVIFKLLELQHKKCLIHLHGQLEIARNRDNKKLLHKTVSEIFFGRLVTLMISLLIYFAVILKASGQYKLLYSVLSLYILGQMNDVSFILQGLEWFKMLAMRNIIIKVLNIVLIFALVREHNDLYIYAIIIHGITLIGNFSLWPQVIKYIKPKSFKNMNFIQHWKKSMIYFIPTVATMVYTVLDKSMIGWITGSEFQNGYYEQAYKIEQILLVFVTTVGTVTFPRMAYFFENDNKEERKRIMGITMKFIMLIACPICFGTMAISENLIPVFLGKGYEECILLLRIFSFLIIIIGLDNTIGKQCLISAGKQKEYNIGVIGGAIVNFVTNILLISKLGACGAAIASVFAESVILVVFIIYSKVELKIPKLSMCFFKYFISAMCMSIMVWRIGILISNKLVALSVQIFVGIILYGLFLLLMKDEFVMESIRRVKLKI